MSWNYGVTGRYAQPEDTKIILNFIIENAKFVGSENQVIATEEILLKNIFGEKPQAEVILAFENDIAVGSALFFYSFSTYLGKAGIYLEDLYVRPEFRGKGYGKALLSKLADIAVKKGFSRLEWSALKSNTRAIEFYTALGAKTKEAWLGFKLEDQSLEDIADKNIY